MNDLLKESVFDVNCDLLLIPVSTIGTISNAFREGLEQLNISSDFWEDNDFRLGDVIILPEKVGNKFIAFVCTVDAHSSAYFAIRLIGRKIAEEVVKLKYIKEVVSPILGTGAGKLQPDLSLNIMRSAFYENKNVEGIRMTFCAPTEEIYSSVMNRGLDLDTPSAQLVIEAELPIIKINELIERIQYEKEFYFEFAEIKFNEYREHDFHRTFYSELYEFFKSKKSTFKDFLNSDLTEEQYEFTKLCGELIAYLDFNAYRKNIWNKYSDKRVLAKSAVRQNDWFLNLLRYKETTQLNSLSPSIKNAFLYLMFPDINLTMLSENHRKKVLDNIFPTSNRGFNNTVIDFFKNLGIGTYNPNNFGILCSRILYLPFIKPLWNENLLNNDLFETKVNKTDLRTVSSLIEECLLKKLKKLDLGNCGLTDLDVIPELFECSELEELILSNEWATNKSGTWVSVL